ncbi:MAG: hypothetical protein HC903_06785 [Methylacidiphilales bacterium]|nr:hypothetical protein [Candidatus Methylacidiphilales bacterium]NJR18227.1 hypothetical protein [Calothrix sp. CSU_2_0]
MPKAYCTVNITVNNIAPVITVITGDTTTNEGAIAKVKTSSKWESNAQLLLSGIPKAYFLLNTM